MKRLVASFLIIMVIMLLVFTGCATKDSGGNGEKEAFTWRLQCAYTEADIEYQVLDPWLEAIKERTNGKLVINKFPGGTIVPEVEQLQACAKGVVDMSLAQGGYWRGTVPIGDIDLGMPGQYPGYDSLESFKDILYEFEDGALGQVFRKAYAEQAGVYYFATHSIHGYPVIMSKKPIRTLDDFKGIVMRAAGSYADLFEEIGVSTVQVPGGEMYTELQLGTLDAATWSIEGFLSYNWYEVAPYIMTPTVSSHSTSHFLINPDSWEALPDNIKEIVEETYFEIFMPSLYEIYQEEWAKVIEKEAELGYEVVEFPEEEMKELRRIAREKIWPAVAAKDEYCKQAVELINRYYETHEN